MSYLTNRPSPGNINTPFGRRPKPTPTSPEIHYGQDYGWGNGEKIYAARAGKVKSFSYSGAYGWRLIIEHGDGTETWYCHNREDGLVVKVGSQVKGGQHISWQGATGNVVGKHLHFELRINGVAVDPEPYFNSSSSPAGGSSTDVENDMALDGEAQHFMNGLGDEIIAQLRKSISAVPEKVWDETIEYTVPATATTPARVVKGEARTWFVNLSNSVGQQAGQIAGLNAALKAALAGKSVDVTAVQEAARIGAQKGAATALEKLTVTVSSQK